MYTALEHTKTQLFASITVKLNIKADECQYDVGLGWNTRVLH